MIGKIPKKWRDAICLALDEGRLAYRVTDAQGRSCNGGDAGPLPFRRWSPYREPRICTSGWHLTMHPHRWDGQRVWIAEGQFHGGASDDKSVWGKIRVLAEVDPRACMDVSAFVRCSLDLRSTDLCGAKLRGAKLRGAKLCGAKLCGADLCGADLCDADLCGADLYGADLYGADLRGHDIKDLISRGAKC